MSAENRFDFHRALEGAEVAPEVERRVVEGALQRLARRRRPLVSQAALVAAAAAAVTVAVLWIGTLRQGANRPGGGPTTSTRPAPRPEPAVGTVWATRAEERSWDLGPHRVQLAPRSRLRFAAGTPRAPRLDVGQGRSLFAVAPLAETGQSFMVQTKQVSVVVVGTRFSVEVSPHCTLVEVESGRVRVIPARGAERELGDGEQQSFCDSMQLDSAGRQVQRAIALAQGGTSLAEAESALAAYVEQQPDGTYAEEAHYFLVLVKRRLDKEDEAIEQARAFVERFPTSERATTLRAWLEKQNP